LSIIFDWAKEKNIPHQDLAQSIKIITFGAECSSIALSDHHITIKVEHHKYDDRLFPLISDAKDYPNYDLMSHIEDRIAPRYPFADWIEDPKPVGNDDAITKITHEIMKCLGLIDHAQDF
jgi:hypothetical protein